MRDPLMTVATGVALLLTLGGLTPVVGGYLWLVDSLVMVVWLIAVTLVVGIRFQHPLVVLATQVVAALPVLTWVGARDVALGGVVLTPSAARRLLDTLHEGTLAMQDTAPPLAGTVPVRLLLISLVAGAFIVTDLTATAFEAPSLAGSALLLPLIIATLLVPKVASAPSTSILGVVGFALLLAVGERHRLAAWGPATSGRIRKWPRVAALVTVASATSVAFLMATLGVASLLLGTRESVSLAPSGSATIMTQNPATNLAQSLKQNRDAQVLLWSGESAMGPLREAIIEDMVGPNLELRPANLSDRDAATRPMGSEEGVSGDVAKTDHEVSVLISNLDGVLLPLPQHVKQVNIGGTWLFDRATRNVYGKRTSLAPDLKYSAAYSRLQLSEDDLRKAPKPSDEFMQRWTALPTNLPPSLPKIARQVAAEGSDYDRVVKLEQYFTSNKRFTYDLSVSSDSSANALETFLDRKRGYCQHFATTHMLMARSLGIPARVAVGYKTPDRKIVGPDGKEWNQVLGADAHAWPEVYFEGRGWVRFEPTPSDTNQPSPAQQEPLPVPRDTVRPSAPQPTAAPIPQPQNQTPAASQPTTQATATSTPGVAPARHMSAWERQLAQVLDWFNRSWTTVLPVTLGSILVVLLVMFGPRQVHRLARQRRQQQCGGADERAKMAWSELSDDCADLGIHLPMGTTELERAASLQTRLASDSAQTDLDQLLSAVLTARYGAPATTPADSLWDSRQRVVNALALSVSAGARGLAWWLPGLAHRWSGQRAGSVQMAEQSAPDPDAAPADAAPAESARRDRRTLRIGGRR